MLGRWKDLRLNKIKECITMKKTKTQNFVSSNHWTKIISILLVAATLLSMLSLTACSKKSNEQTALKTDTTTVASYCAKDEVDGTTIMCEYDVNDGQYTLSLDNNVYPLHVEVVDDYAYISFAENSDNPFESDKVVAQSAIAVAASAPYWAPAVVAAAKTLIIKVVCVTATVVGAYISADAIGTTINKVKTNSISKSKAKSAVSSWTLVKNAGRTSSSRYYYYEAQLIGSQIMVGNSISHQSAVNRLRRGYDVVASGYHAARSAAGAAATIVGKTYHHNAHGTGENFLKHFHPYGRKWHKNTRHMPHCWYLG